MSGTMNSNAGGVGAATVPRRFQPAEAKAFCDGMAYRLSGTAAGKPKANNPYKVAPYSTTTDAQIIAAWDNGWDSADANNPGALVPYNCNLSGTVSA